MVEYRDLGGLEGAALDELIARQVQTFAQRGESFERKSTGTISPADLPDRLRAAGFVAEPQETVVVAPTGAIAREPSPPPGVSLREVNDEWASIASRPWRRASGAASTAGASPSCSRHAAHSTRSR